MDQDVPLEDLPVEARRALPFDHPALDAHAAKVEAEHGLPTGILRALKNNGERSQSGAVSPKGAQGVMQFMPETGARYGLKDATDPLESINAGGRYVKDIVAKIGSSDPALIAAGYNSGENRQSLREGRVPAIPETQAYAQRVKAAMPAYASMEMAVPENDLPPAARAPAPAAPAPKRELLDENGIPITLDPTAKRGALDPTRGRTFTENAMAGAGKAVADAGRGITQLVGTYGYDKNPIAKAILPNIVGRYFQGNQAAIDEAAKNDAALTHSGAGLTGNVAGNIATTVLPGGALKAAGTLAKAPEMVAAGAALNAAPATFRGAAAAGAGFGAAQPVTTEEGELGRLKNAGMGAFGGMGGKLVASAVGAGARGVKALVEPFYEKGKDAIAGRLLNRVAGEEAPAIAARLKAAAAPAMGPFQPGMEKTVMGELVPGSLPTVGQAAGDAGIAALERTATAIDPAVTRAHAERLAGQNAARVGQLETMAGTAADRDAAVAARKAAADPFYVATIPQAVEGDAHMVDLLQRPAMRKAWARAQELAANNGETISLAAKPGGQVAATNAAGAPIIANVAGKPPVYSVRGLHYLKMALDDALDNPALAGIGAHEQAALAGSKDRLLQWLDAKVPDYASARQAWQMGSRPVNQMDTARAIAEGSIRPGSQQLPLESFARQLKDKTAARATGFRGSTLENTMEPQQLGMLGNILADLQRSHAAQTAGKGVGSDTVQKLAYSNIVDQAGVPTFLRNFGPTQAAGNIVAKGAKMLYGDANQSIANRVAETMMDPGMAARLMEQAAAQRAPSVAARLGSATLPRLGAVLPSSIPQVQQQ